MGSEAMILKRDAGGRVVVPVARQIELVREYERSGLSGPKFAAMAGLKYQTFATWRRTRLKILCFDGTGLWLMTKRLGQGTFFWPKAAESGQGKLKLTPEAFALLTDGIDMHGARPRGWYERE